MKTFFTLLVWKKAHEFVLKVYKVTANFPEHEKFGLRSQFTRAAVSIAANIAEGYGKISKTDKLRFYNISQGSIDECRYYILLAKDLKYITEEEYKELCILIKDTSRLLVLYINGINNNNYNKTED